MLNECINGLSIDPAGIYLDGTAGGGGHSLEIARRLTSGRLYCTDRDSEAVAAAAEKLAGFPQAMVKAGNFARAGELFGIADGSLSGALLDLGVSSRQLDSPDRGFSYHSDGHLDMRMGQEGPTAADLVNTLDVRELADIIRRYGEEPNAAAIARGIAAARRNAPITSTLGLSEVILSSVPAAARRGGRHPARRTFQALRIAVNGELDYLDEGLNAIFELLAPKGRFCVITFHSLEDRIVKHFFARLQGRCTCPPDFPQCVCGQRALASLVTKKPIAPSGPELASNRRARSAKLRIVEKL
jgi:16S rRNA (cytosine1402-N4)-methyltransferase